MCLCVCVLQRRVTLAGCAGVTCPPRGSVGVHIEDGMQVCVKGADSQASPCALQLLWTDSSSESNWGKDSNAPLIASHVPQCDFNFLELTLMVWPDLIRPN